MTGAESEITSNFYLVLFVILIAYFVTSLIGNMFLVGASGENKWFGLIPIINDYFIYKIYWSQKVFVVYILAVITKILSISSNNTIIVAICLISNVILLIIEVMLADHISKAFDKNVLWTLGLLILFPVFAIILGWKGTLSEDIKKKFKGDDSMFCKNCGKEIDDNAVICPHCGVAQKDTPEVVDNGGFGWGLLGCCIPVVGLILFLVWRDTKPKTAKAAGIGALVSVAIAILWYVLVAVVGIGAGLSSATFY